MVGNLIADATARYGAELGDLCEGYALGRRLINARICDEGYVQAGAAGAFRKVTADGRMAVWRGRTVLSARVDGVGCSNAVAPSGGCRRVRCRKVAA